MSTRGPPRSFQFRGIFRPWGIPARGRFYVGKRTCRRDRPGARRGREPGGIGKRGRAGPAPPAPGAAVDPVASTATNAPAAPTTSTAPPRTGWRYRDFTWVFIARFLVTTGNSVALFYLFYYLRDHIGHADPDAGVLILTGAYAVCVVVTAIVSGKASDASGKRRPFVALSSMGVSAACVVMAVAGSFVTVIVAAILLGLSWGVFMAVDQALINQVLPKADERGRDLGVMNLAVAGPNVAAPVLAAFALANLGGYPGLYVFAGVLTVIGAGLVYLVRGVP